MLPPPGKPSFSSLRGSSSTHRNPNALRKTKLGLQKQANNPGIAKKNDAIRRTQIKRSFHRAHLQEQAGVSVLAGADGEIDWELGNGGGLPVGVGLGLEADGEQQQTNEERGAQVDKRRLPKAKATPPEKEESDTAPSTPATATSNKPGRGGVQQHHPPPPKPHHKPNPFAKLVKEAERVKQEKLAAAEEARRLKTEQAAARKDYYAKRSNTRNHLQKKTRKGQPVMANQISHLLDKIQGKK
ncbi:hypothetical protein HDU86_005641 [Geranomyces michiganensis]|nr:hypothetical protein HDU86_005641 [Geranomyces michiganensis]